MKNRKKNILIWLLSWAVLSLLVIYSPLGSPELYRQDNYIVYNQGVNFSGGIANASAVRSYQQSEDPDVNLPVYTPAAKTYTVNTVSTKTNSTSANTNYSVSTPVSNQSVSTRGNSGGGAGGNFLYVGSRYAAQSKPTLQMNGITTLNTELNPSDNSKTRQLVTDGVTDGGTDPGSDPTGPPIPVGDGIPVLLLFAVFYMLYIKRSDLTEPRVKNQESRQEF